MKSLSRNPNRNRNPDRDPLSSAEGQGGRLRLGLRLRLGIARTRWLLLTALFVLATAALASACNVPVFRFALERWRADPYRAVLLHRGELSDADREQIALLVDKQDQSLANLTVRTVDVSQLAADSEDAALAAALGEA